MLAETRMGKSSFTVHGIGVCCISFPGMGPGGVNMPSLCQNLDFVCIFNFQLLFWVFQLLISLK